MPETLVKPTFKPEIDFEVEPHTEVERSTIVHCVVQEFSLIRIWPSTFLVQENGVRKKLLQAYNIAQYPSWRWAFHGHKFTLVFEGLDKDCLLFDLLEDIPQEGGFHLENIERNKTDVYWLTVQ
jgi:hypothetical protein